MASNTSDQTSSAIRPLDGTAFPPFDETYRNPPSYQQLDNVATAPPLANDHAFRSTSLSVPDPRAQLPSCEEVFGPVDKTHEEESKKFSGPGGYSSIDDQFYTPRFKNETRTRKSDRSTVITKTQPGARTNRASSQEEVCTGEDCQECMCIVCLYCCRRFVEILFSFTELNED